MLKKKFRSSQITYNHQFFDGTVFFTYYMPKSFAKFYIKSSVVYKINIFSYSFEKFERMVPLPPPRYKLESANEQWNCLRRYQRWKNPLDANLSLMNFVIIVFTIFSYLGCTIKLIEKKRKGSCTNYVEKWVPVK